MKFDSKAKTPEEYFEELEEPRKSEVLKLHKLITKTVPKLKPFMLSGLLGYGKIHYKYSSGREGDWFKIGLSSGKTGISVHVCAVDKGGYLAEQAKPKLGKATVGRSCIRFKKLEDINLDALTELLKLAAVTPMIGETE